MSGSLFLTREALVRGHFRKGDNEGRIKSAGVKPELLTYSSWNLSGGSMESIQ